MSKKKESVAFKRMTIHLIHCGNRSLIESQKTIEKYIFFMPMGIFSLADILNKNGYNVKINHLDIETGGSINEILDLNSIDAIGFDLHWMNQSINVLDTSRLIKEINPEIFIFLGGYSASYYAEEILNKYKQIDAIIRGDGEIPVLELCNVLDDFKIHDNIDKEKLSQVQNLVWRNDENSIIHNEFSYVSNETQLNSFEFANIELLNNWRYFKDISKYWTNFETIKDCSVFFLEIGRGCNYTCSICGGSLNSQRIINNRNCQSIRSIDSVIKTIQQGVSYGFNCFFVCFDFSSCNEYYIDLFNSIKECQLKISFIYECWSLPSEKFIDMLSESVANSIIALSPDSGSDQIRKSNKDNRLFFSNDELIQCIDYIYSKGNIKVQLWFGYFLPHDTKESVFETLSLIIKMYSKYPDFLEITYMPNNTDPASSIYNNPEKHDMKVSVTDFDSFIKKIEDNYYSNNKGFNLISSPKQFTENEAVDLANKIIFFNRILEFKSSLLNLLNDHKNIIRLIEFLDVLNFESADRGRFENSEIKIFLEKFVSKFLDNDAYILELVQIDYNNIILNPSKQIEFYSKEKSKLHLSMKSIGDESDFAF